MDHRDGRFAVGTRFSPPVAASEPTDFIVDRCLAGALDLAVGPGTTPEDAAKFEAQAAKLGAQYEAYAFPALPGMDINGRVAMGENILATSAASCSDLKPIVRRSAASQHQ